MSFLKILWVACLFFLISFSLSVNAEVHEGVVKEVEMYEYNSGGSITNVLKVVVSPPPPAVEAVEKP